MNRPAGAHQSKRSLRRALPLAIAAGLAIGQVAIFADALSLPGPGGGAIPSASPISVPSAPVPTLPAPSSLPTVLPSILPSTSPLPLPSATIPTVLSSPSALPLIPLASPSVPGVLPTLPGGLLPPGSSPALPGSGLSLPVTTLSLSAGVAPPLVVTAPGQSSVSGRVLVAGPAVSGYRLLVRAVTSPVLSGPAGAIPDYAARGTSPETWDSAQADAFGLSVSGPCVDSGWGAPSTSAVDSRGRYLGLGRQRSITVSACGSGSLSDSLDVILRLADDGSIPAGTYSAVLRFTAVPAGGSVSPLPSASVDMSVSARVLASSCRAGCGRPSSNCSGCGSRSGTSSRSRALASRNPIGLDVGAAGMLQVSPDEHLSPPRRVHELMPLAGLLPRLPTDPTRYWWVLVAATVFVAVYALGRAQLD